MDTVSGGHLRHPPGKIAGQETPVVADHQGLIAQSLAIEVIHGGLRHQGQVVKGKIAGDHAAPAVGTEFYLHGTLQNCQIIACK